MNCHKITEDLKEDFPENERFSMFNTEKSTVAVDVCNTEIVVKVKEEPSEVNDINNDDKKYVDVEVRDYNISLKEELVEVLYGECSENVKAERDYVFCEEVCLGSCCDCPKVTIILNNRAELGIACGIRRTLPKNLLTIKSSAVDEESVFSMVTIPEGVIFGPFNGLERIQKETNYVWKLEDTKFVTADPRSLNWMSLVKSAKDTVDQNLNIFQHKGRLFFKSSRLINKGEELLLYYGDEYSKIIDSETERYINPVSVEYIESVYGCTFCCVGFSSEMHLRKHRLKCRVFKSGDLDELIQCAFCDIFFNKAEYMEFHMNYCANKNTWGGTSSVIDSGSLEKPFTCEICQKTFTHKLSLKLHKISHVAQEKPFECVRCKKGFALKTDLEVHMRTHTAPMKQYECVTCHKCFAAKAHLIAHMRTHTGEKPYVCELCHKSFTAQGSLQAHMRTHADDKPFKCDICTRTFVYQYGLIMHMHSHREKETFKCGKCKKSFTRKGILELHMRTHTE